MSRKLKVGGACLNQTPIDWKNNIQNITNVINDAKKQGVAILCLPELCITGYGCEDLFLSEWLPGKALDKLKEIIPLTSDIAVSVGVPIRIGDKNYNTTCFISNQKILGFYAKQKLANDGVHYEPRWFTPWEPNRIIDYEIGSEKIPFGHITLKHKSVKIGFEICEDAWQEGRPAESLDEPVDLILNPSASHFAFNKARYREEEIVIKSSKKFDCLYLYTNLLGNEAGRMIYDGDILISHKGKLIGHNRRLSFQDYNLLSVEVDFDDQEVTPTIQRDMTNQNEEFSRAASLALFDYLRKSKSNGYVLSLSGGADSSSIAILVAEVVRNGMEELGFDEFQRKVGFTLNEKDLKSIVGQLLITAYQGTVNSSNETFQSAKTLAESIGATFHDWKIDQEIEEYRNTIEKAIHRQLNWEIDDIALQNIQARARSPIIWMLANINNSLLLATSNRSEGDVGYATMDGDTSGSISPIAGVSKFFVLSWLKYAEQELGYSGLTAVNQLTPTAELRPGTQNQTDEQDLMPYRVLVEIEREAILNGKTPKDIFNALKADHEEKRLKEWIKKYFRLWSRNQWKRERLAPSFHFDDFNIDPRSWYRFPILSGGFEDELEL